MEEHVLPSNCMRLGVSLMETPEEEHDSDDVSALDEDDDLREMDDEPILVPRGAGKEPKSSPVHARKPYLKQTESSKQETMRKMEIYLNGAAHTPDFLPGAYTAPKLSTDAVSLLADFIQRPAVRKQLVPFLGEIRGKKRKRSATTKSKNVDPQNQGDANASRGASKSFISPETGRLVRTKLTEAQTRVLLEKFEEKKHWTPREVASMLPALNQPGPPDGRLDAEQVRRWFDNKRRAKGARNRGGTETAKERTVAVVDFDRDDPPVRGDALGGVQKDVHQKKQNKKDAGKNAKTLFGDKEVQILNAAFARNPAPDIQTRHALATATGVREKNVTAWFKRRQAEGQVPYGSVSGIRAPPGRAERLHHSHHSTHPPADPASMFLPGITLPAMHHARSFGGAHWPAPHSGRLHGDGYVNSHDNLNVFDNGTGHGLPAPGPPGFGMPNPGADVTRR